MSAAREARPWWLGPAVTLGAAALALLGATWRYEYVDADGTRLRGPKREPDLFALWHARLLMMAWAHRGLGGAVLISRHRDGELIAGVVRRLGFVAARGSSTRGGGAGALEMLRWAGEGRSLGVTPDGPRGPAERAKDGVVWLASRSGRPVVPTAAAARPEWVMRSWDRFRVPKPFARVRVCYGAAIAVPPELDEPAVSRWRQTIEDALIAVTRAAESGVGARP